jgi:ABC-type nitrate/sulfonate/bicarbonate transport system permease component
MKKFWEKIGTTEIRNIIAIITVCGAFVVLLMLVIKPIPPDNKDTLNLALGFVLGGLVGGVSGYFFGSSKKNDNEVQK